MIITSKLKMDLDRPGILPAIHAVQDDSYSRDLEITLLSRGAPCKIPAGSRVLIRYRKADGTGGEYDTLPDGTPGWTAKDHVLTVRLAPQVLTAPGRVTVSVTVASPVTRLSLFPVGLEVARLAGADIAESENYFHITGFLPAPVSASVGDYIRVANVDAFGHVTAVEAAAGAGGGEDSAIPGCWLGELKAGVKAINTALCNAGRNKSAFLFYTDAHWNFSARMSPKLLKYLYRNTGMTKTVFGGDIVQTESSDYDTMAYLWNWRSQLKDLPNHHSVVGNHDDGNTTDGLFPQNYIYGYLLAAEETGDVVREDTGLYYYVDCPAEKTRYLYLDTAWQGATSQQQAFMKNALLTCPEGWHIVAIAHIWHDTDYTVSPPVPAGINGQAKVFLDLFDSFNARSGEFSGSGAKVEFCIGGHTHWDYDSRSTGGIPILLAETDSWAVRSGLSYTAGTAGEAAVSGIIADYGAGKITLVRVGRGSSRVVSLTGGGSEVIPDPDVPQGNPDNLLTTAVDSDGTLCPWEENTRWSGSSNGEVAEEGTFLSGHIPYTPGQTVYLKNVQIYNVTSGGVIHYFSAPGVRIGGTHATDVVKYWSGITDSENRITRFTMFTDDAYAGVHYIRIECSGFDSTSVVTVDNPIE